MTVGLFNRRISGMAGMLVVLVAGLVAGPAVAKPLGAQSLVDTSMCSDPQLSQPFLSARDTNWYTLAPGESVGNFDGGGWTLSGGAQIVSARLADGQTGSVLDLPTGSTAISPSICVASDYPTARTMVQNAPGANVAFAVSYAGTKSWDKPSPAGSIKGTGTGWSVSNPFQVHPGNLPGWQLVRFTLASNGKSSDAKIYNFYIDPRMKA
jgi:hypothetical protein